MRFGLNIGYAGARMALDWDLILEAERLGFHSVWSAEAYGSDAVTPLAFIAARTERLHLATGIMQMPARTPAMTAMTAMTLDQLSGGRFILGLGVSGPQVVEGWHGVPYGKPLVRTREYVEIVRAIWARERPLEHRGVHYRIPYDGPGASGLGKPLRSILHGRQLPIYVAAVGPKSVAQAAEIADGWLPIFYSPERAPQVYREPLEAGFRKAGKSAADFDIAVSVTVIVGDDVKACLEFVKPMLALYIGGRGAREELLQRPRLPLRLRRRGEAHPGPLPRRQEGGGDGARPRRARRRGVARRPEGAHPRPPPALARLPGGHAHLRHAAGGGAAGAGGGRGLSASPRCRLVSGVAEDGHGRAATPRPHRGHHPASVLRAAPPARVRRAGGRRCAGRDARLSADGRGRRRVDGPDRRRRDDGRAGRGGRAARLHALGRRLARRRPRAQRRGARADPPPGAAGSTRGRRARAPAQGHARPGALARGRRALSRRAVLQRRAHAAHADPHEAPGLPRHAGRQAQRPGVVHDRPPPRRGRSPVPHAGRGAHPGMSRRLTAAA